MGQVSPSFAKRKLVANPIVATVLARKRDLAPASAAIVLAGVRWSWRYSFLGEVWLAAPGGPGRAICYAMPSGCQAWAT